MGSPRQIKLGMFLRPAVVSEVIGLDPIQKPAMQVRQWPILAAVVISVTATLLFGVVPIDRRTMEFEVLEEGRFVESSTSWLNGRARHERTAIGGVGGSTVLTDRLVIESRGMLVDALIRASVTQTFRRRHRRLRRHFEKADRAPE